MAPETLNDEAQSLANVLASRLDESALDEHAKYLVLAAYDGEQALRDVLEAPPDDENRGAEAIETERAERQAAYLNSITVAGFRGIGPEATLPLRPGPGLTLVVGRNGSGKSSFAEAAEMALTGDNARWNDRSQVWRAGWRNLHADTAPKAAVELSMDGDRGKTSIVRGWTGPDLADSHATVQRPGQQRADLATLGWEQDLVTYRPFLSYSELGRMIDGKPSEMYDAVAAILGLERLTHAEQRLSAARKAFDDSEKKVKQDLNRVQAQLADVDDPRAREAEEAMGGRNWNLDKVDELASGSADQDQAGQLATLRRLSQLAPPDEEQVIEASAKLRAAAEQMSAQRGTDAESAQQLAELLQQALDHQRRHQAARTCPVCGTQGVLDDAWVGRVEPEIRRLRQQASDVEQAHRQVQESVRSARRLLTSPPEWLPDDSPVLPAWRQWERGAELDDPTALADHLEGNADQLWQACGAASSTASERLAQLEEDWRPAAKALRSWVDEARAMRNSVATHKAVKDSVQWLRDVGLELRNDRLRPLAEQSTEIWRELRQASNVDLGSINLAGAKTQRKLELDVKVDGAEGSALGVMSQGELHALALALFLPRATMSESPFRFLVIDDPVQSMDPAKVDGLARVLTRIANAHQVVVFTHDARLPDAVRRLQLPATIWEVTRREGSIVEVEQSDDTVARLLGDARALTNTPELPTVVGPRVVPGLCRQAVEATLTERVRRQRLSAGARHADVEDAIVHAQGPYELAALALFGDASRTDEVLRTMNSKYGRHSADTFVACKKAGHAASAHDLKSLINDTAMLAERIRNDR